MKWNKNIWSDTLGLNELMYVYCACPCFIVNVGFCKLFVMCAFLGWNETPPYRQCMMVHPTTHGRYMPIHACFEHFLIASYIFVLACMRSTHNVASLNELQGCAIYPCFAQLLGSKSVDHDLFICFGSDAQVLRVHHIILHDVQERGLVAHVVPRWGCGSVSSSWHALGNVWSILYHARWFCMF